MTFCIDDMMLYSFADTVCLSDFNSLREVAIAEDVLKYPSHLKGQTRMNSIMDHVIPEDTWTEYQYRRLNLW